MSKKSTARKIRQHLFFAQDKCLEELLLEGLASGVSKRMTANRKRQIYKQVLTNF
jgi:hypothetical protein